MNEREKGSSWLIAYFILVSGIDLNDKCTKLNRFRNGHRVQGTVEHGGILIASDCNGDQTGGSLFWVCAVICHDSQLEDGEAQYKLKTNFRYFELRGTLMTDMVLKVVILLEVSSDIDGASGSIDAKEGWGWYITNGLIHHLTLVGIRQ